MAVGDLGLVLIGRAILSKSLNQFSVGEQGCVPYHSLALCQTTGREHSPTHQQKIVLNIY